MWLEHQYIFVILFVCWKHNCCEICAFFGCQPHLSGPHSSVWGSATRSGRAVFSQPRGGRHGVSQGSTNCSDSSRRAVEGSELYSTDGIKGTCVLTGLSSLKCFVGEQITFNSTDANRKARVSTHWHEQQEMRANILACSHSGIMDAVFTIWVWQVLAGEGVHCILQTNMLLKCETESAQDQHDLKSVHILSGNWRPDKTLMNSKMDIWFFVFF